MSELAKIVVTAGPDRGKVFEADDELVHIGKGPENQIVLEDKSLADHQASLVRRNGRYAIYTPLKTGVDVDGSTIPTERWVWLPESVTVQLGKRTTLEFTLVNGADDDSDSEEEDEAEETSVAKIKAPSAGEQRSSGSSPGDSPLKNRSRRKKAKRGNKKQAQRDREVARFITDKSGETLVQLGDDGHMPELVLSEATAKKSKKKEKTESNPILMYVAIGFSMLFSVGMLLMDSEIGSSSTVGKASARSDIRVYYGEENVEPYQELLRQAELAHIRRDRKMEVQTYRHVLDLLNAEDNNRFTGLTGKKTGETQSDEHLKDLIITLIGK